MHKGVIIISSKNANKTISNALKRMQNNFKSNRSVTTVGGVRISALPSASRVAQTDSLILETSSGTRKINVKGFSDYIGSGMATPQEVIDARNDGSANHPNLKARLDSMDNKTKSIQNNTNKLQEEIDNAKNDGSTTHATLKARLDEMSKNMGGGNSNSIKELEEKVTKNEQSITNLTQVKDDLKKEVEEARVDTLGLYATHGSLKERLDSDFNKNQQKSSELETKIDDVNDNLTIEINNLYEYLNPKVESLNKKANEIYIEEFDGVDDTEKFTKAMDSLTNGGTIVLKNKEYTFGAIEVKGNTTLIGSGNTIVKPNANLGTKPLIHLKGSNILIRDLRIEDGGMTYKGLTVGDYGSFTGSGHVENVCIENVFIRNEKETNPAIQIGHSTNVVVNNCKVVNVNVSNPQSNTYALGIVVHADTGTNFICENITISNNVVEGFYKGIHSYGTAYRYNMNIYGNKINNCFRAIEMYHGSTYVINSNLISNCSVGVYADSQDVKGAGYLGDVVSNNRIINCSLYGIYAEEMRSGLITGNTIQKCGEGIHAGAGITETMFSNNNISYNTIGIRVTNDAFPTPLQKYYNKDCTIMGNTISCNNSHGIKLEGAVGYWHIKNNVLTNNGKLGSSHYAIWFGNDDTNGWGKASEHLIISDNTIHNKGGNDEKGMQQGIKNGGDFSSVVINNNYFAIDKNAFELSGGNKYIMNNIIASGTTSNTGGSTIVSSGNYGY